MRVLMCQKQFVPKILDGSKIHTIRGRARCKPGDDLSLRYWKKRGGRWVKGNKQMEFLRTKCKAVWPVSIQDHGVFIHGMIPVKLNDLARHDGFDSWLDMRDWFDRTHGLPWSGDLIQWEKVQ
jgi:hypothetical protein